MNDFTILDEQNVETTGAATEGAETTTVVTETKKKNEQPAYIKEFIEEYNKDETVREQMNAWSDSIEVINTCGYTDRGALIQVDPGVKVKNEDGTTKVEGRNLNTTSLIVGYVFKNVGTETIPYTTEIWKTVDGKFVSEVVDLEFAPGETITLSKKYTTLFAAKLEISNKFKNAKLICQGAGKRTFEELLESAYIVFSEGENKTVHDGDVKIPIAERVGEQTVKDKTVGIYKVMPQYFEVFGFLDKPKQKEEKAKKEVVKGNLRTAAMAAYVRKVAEKTK